MSGVSRRDLLRRIGASASLAGTGEGVLAAQQAGHVHHAVAEDKAKRGVYRPKALTAHEYACLQRLAELILPADERSPGALAAGAADYIDFLCSVNGDIKEIYTGGIAWLDARMRQRCGKDFAAAPPEQQAALLDKIAWRKNASPEWNAGIEFFAWVRNMTVDAYYTSPVGVKEIGFMGNGAMSEFSVPKEAVEHALKRSPFATPPPPRL
jgi:gluconate 2-dehydrogenase gamma chain